MKPARWATAFALGVVAMACGGKERGTSQPDGSAPDAESATPCPIQPANGPPYLPPDAVPTGKACDATTTCLVSTGTPCAEPNELPPISLWQCTCAAGTWSCAFTGMTKSVCVELEAGTDASPSTDAGVPTDATMVPDASASPDALAGTCGGVCATDQDCQNACPPAFETFYCCDVDTKRCFVGDDGPTCPLHTNPSDAGLQGCLASGCAAGEVCVTYDSLDPPEEPVPSCFALPAACAGDPTCVCLLDSGVCGSGSSQSCTGGDAAAITCFE